MSLWGYFIIYNTILSASLKHFNPTGIKSNVRQHNAPMPNTIIAKGSLTIIHIAADSNAPVIINPNQNKNVSSASIIIISIIQLLSFYQTNLLLFELPL